MVQNIRCNQFQWRSHIFGDTFGVLKMNCLGSYGKIKQILFKFRNFNAEKEFKRLEGRLKTIPREPFHCQKTF